MHMAKAATRYGVPILGVNIGTMGFMAELESSELHQLTRLGQGEFEVESRMMLDVTVQRNQDVIFQDFCLNDVVVTKGSVARIINLSIRCDGVQAMGCSGDGVVDARDSLRILKYAVGTYKLEGAYSKAADVSKDQENDSRDSLRILKYAVGTYNIEL